MKNETNILVVDDKPANIFALENLLSDRGRKILHASNGKDALKIAINEEIDLIILDVQMPEMDGFEVANILKSSSRTKDIPIIFASAEKTELDSMMKGYEEGAIDYLFKPLNPGIAKAKVSVLLKLQKQKKELQEKNKSLERSALLINNSADIIGVIDPVSFTIEEVNHAFTAILGYSAEEARNTPLTFFLAKQERDAVIKLSKSSENLLSFETQICCKDKSIKWLQWKVVVNSGKWYVNARDITELKNADEEIRKLNRELQENNLQLQAANRELESFSYSVSHDLRAPLRAMGGFSRILEEDYSKVLDNEGKRLLKNIEASARKMGTLIDELLAFSRVGKKEMHRTFIDMAQLVKEIVKDNTRTAHAAKIDIHALPGTYGDPVLLAQVWVNLISNAIKYSSRKELPVIEIGADKNGDYITYYVKDNGAGFNMEYAHKMFGVFQRLHGQEEFEGTGIGLAIVQRIISRHGGRVWAEGEVQKGATFYFTLPAHSESGS
jgi:PAS domain S-box-containing protein